MAGGQWRGTFGRLECRRQFYRPNGEGCLADARQLCPEWGAVCRPWWRMFSLATDGNDERRTVIGAAWIGQTTSIHLAQFAFKRRRFYLQDRLDAGHLQSACKRAR